jgi:Nucleoside 2-deoxyribosyltransferase like
MDDFYYESPAEYNGDGPSLFLAGGITGCEDWQSDIRSRLAHVPVALFNPRRSNFDFKDPFAAQKQIEWEYRHLRKADGILFWFTHETIQPIVLFELGAHSFGSKPIFVGSHPAYSRNLDVLIQLRLARPGLVVHDSLEELALQVESSYFGGGKPSMPEPLQYEFIFPGNKHPAALSQNEIDEPWALIRAKDERQAAKRAHAHGLPDEVSIVVRVRRPGERTLGRLYRVWKVESTEVEFVVEA